MKQIRQLLDEIVRNTDLSDVNLRKLLVKELTDIQARRKAELAEQERIDRQKVKEIQKNQSEQPEDRLENREKGNIRSTKSNGSSGSAKERAKLMRQKRREKLAERRAKKKQ